MSGSTVVSSRSGLSAPKSPVDDNSTAASFHYATDESDIVVSDNKFAFSPGQLNKLLNPKSLQAYAALGGIRGLERGLRTNLQTGLSVDETNLEGAIAFEEATQRPPKSYGYQSQDSSAPRPSDTTPAQASSEAFADRIRIFKKNTLPEKKPTPLWKLVWRAYNDKVLILLTVAAVISLALGLYETFGVEHDPNEPMPVDWVVSDLSARIIHIY
jgi:P-type Ca2+ transporter type 2C